jgi:hypothetical protein
MLENLYNFKTELNKQGIFFCFSGPISQELLVEIGDTLKNKMKLEDTNSSTILKVFSMFVEQSQNIIHYSTEKISNKPKETTELSTGIIVVGHDSGHYFVLCGNMVNNDSVKTLREQLTKLQTMNKDELKRYYKEQRRKETPEHSKGAGLGFIELARKAVQPIQFDFQPVDEKSSFFSLKTEI